MFEKIDIVIDDKTYSLFLKLSKYLDMGLEEFIVDLLEFYIIVENFNGDAAPSKEFVKKENQVTE